MKRLKFYREKVKMTQKELAQCLAVGQSTVSMWESTDAYPRGELLPIIADLLGCTIDQLYGRETPAAE